MCTCFCFAHLVFDAFPHPVTFLRISRVCCVQHLPHPVQRVRGPPSGSDPNSRIQCDMHSTNSTPSSPCPFLCCPCACSAAAVSGPRPQPLLYRWRSLAAAHSSYSYIVAGSGDTCRNSRPQTTHQLQLPVSQQMLHKPPSDSLLWQDARREGAWSSPAECGPA